MSDVNFALRKVAQGYVMPMARALSTKANQPACHNCHHRIAHYMQCGRGGFFVQASGVCDMHKAAAIPVQNPVAHMVETCVGADVFVHGVKVPDFAIGTGANHHRQAFVDAVNAAAAAAPAGNPTAMTVVL
jgi:hypothetical protein